MAFYEAIRNAVQVWDHEITGPLDIGTFDIICRLLFQ